MKNAKIIMGFVAALIMSHATPTMAQNSVQQEKPIAEYKERVLTAAADLVRAKSELSQLWPGYWPENQAFIIYHKEYGALLISTSGKPEAYKPIANAQLPEELWGIAFLHKEALDNIIQPFYLNYDVGDGQKAVVVNYSDMVTIPSREAIIGTLLHEQFHAYQNVAFTKRKDAFVGPLDIKDRVGYASLAEIERRVLIGALSTSNKEHQIELLEQYFVVRRAREKTVPLKLIKAERYLERSEGVAQYTEELGLTAINKEGDKGLRQRLIKALGKDFFEDNSLYIPNLFRSKSYQVGSALTYLISQYDDGQWRKEIEKGDAVDQYLESLIVSKWQKKPDTALEKAKQKFGYDAIYQLFEPTIKANEKAEIKSVDAFFALHPFRLVFDLEMLSEKTRAGFSATNMFSLEPSVTAIENTEIFNSSGSAYSFTVRDRPLLFGKSFTVLLDERPEIIGHTQKGVGEYPLDSLQISNASLEIKVDRKMILIVKDDQITIQILPL